LDMRRPHVGNIDIRFLPWRILPYATMSASALRESRPTHGTRASRRGPLRGPTTSNTWRGARSAVRTPERSASGRGCTIPPTSPR
jgi:hypothetical protein